MSVATAIELTSAVEVFPSTKTTTINRLITENSITRLINRLLDIDGYIISSEFAPEINTSIAYDFLPTTGQLLNKDLEISLRGYYFNFGKIKDVKSAIGQPASVSDEIKAIIYVDTSNPDYPELYGYNYEPVTEYVEDDSLTLDSKYTNDNSYGFTFYDSSSAPVEISGVVQIGTGDNANKLVDGNNDLIDLTGVSAVKFNYTIIESCIRLYHWSENVEPPAPTIQTETDDLVPYELTIFKATKYDDDSIDWVIPLSSLHKFDSISVNKIDGGLISLDKPVPDTTE